MSTLRVDISRHDTTAIYRLAGSLTAKNVAILRRASFEAEVDGQPGRCAMDMGEVDEIDGYGLSALVGLLARCGQAGRVVLFQVSPDIRIALEATFCDALFSIRNTEAAALELLSDGP